MSDQPLSDEKRMRLRFAGVCRVCDAALPAKTDAIYERSTKTVRCAGHLAAAERGGVEVGTVELDAAGLAPIDPGTPGASARREFERRRAGREQRIRAKHPLIGGLLHALSDEPQSTTAWDTGAQGEEGLGNRLNEFSSDHLRVLHDRRIPGSRANIDHIAVTPTGIYVIDAKKYAGRPRLKIEGGLVRPRTEKLLVGTRNCTRLVDGVIKQAGIVAGAVDAGIPVHAVLCFVDADWPLLGSPFTTRGVEVLWPKKLYPKLAAEGPIGAAAISAIHGALAEALAPA